MQCARKEWRRFWPNWILRGNKTPTSAPAIEEHVFMEVSSCSACAAVNLNTIEQSQHCDSDTATLFSTLYAQLHSLARRELARRIAPSNLSVTTLLHEAYINMSQKAGGAFPDQARFVRVTGTNLDRIPRVSFDLASGKVNQMAPQQAT